MPVWGAAFVRQFLDFCLPTLLAPGNIPALAQGMVDGIATLQEVIGRYARRTIDTANKSRALSSAGISGGGKSATLALYNARLAIARAALDR